MIVASHGIIGSSIGQFSFDTDYEAVLNYAISQEYTLPSASQQLLQNQLLVDLKAAGVWSKLDTFAVFATDGDADFALIDWKRLVDYTAVDSPTFTTNQGYKGNGTSAFIDTLYNYNGNVSQNDLHFGGYVFNDKTVFNILGGVDSGSNDVAIFTDLNDNQSFARINNIGRQSFVGVNQIGVHIISRNNGTSVDLISSNGFISNQLRDSVTGTPNGNITVLRWDTFYSDATSAIVHAGLSVNSELSDFRNALDTYMASI